MPRVLPSFKKGERKPKPQDEAPDFKAPATKRTKATTAPNSGVSADEFKRMRKRKKSY